MMEEIYKHYSHLTTTDNLVYKSCQNEWLVVLSKLDDTKTNEDRDDVKDNRFAKFRANKLKVEMIFNKFDPSKTIDRIENSVYKDANCKYIAGETIIADRFDEDINKVCGRGIHYFKTLEPAYYLELYGFVKDGKFKEWHANGKILCQCFYKDGNLDGEYKIWYENGEILEECFYKNGILDGWFKERYYNGNPKIEYFYKDGKLDGEYKSWYYNGQNCHECFYKDGKLVGWFKKWYDNGNLKEETFYKDGEKDDRQIENYSNDSVLKCNNLSNNNKTIKKLKILTVLSLFIYIVTKKI